MWYTDSRWSVRTITTAELRSMHMTDKQWIRERLAALRASMREQNVQYVIIPTGDYHNSEYVSDFFRTREFYTGFTGSNGTLLVTDREARLWTDGRYFVQAEKELEGTDILLMKMSEEGVPTLPRLIAGQYREGERIGVDERIIPIHTVELLMHALEEKLHTKMEAGNVLVHMDPAEGIWHDRPCLPCGRVFIMPEELAGERTAVRLQRLRRLLADERADGIVISRLDDIMWLFNIRGRDVECNPVALSYAYVDGVQAVLFLQEGAKTDELETYAQAENFRIMEYGALAVFLGQIRGQTILLDPVYTSEFIHRAVLKQNSIITGQNPTTAMKAVKNERELDAIRKAYLMDSVAVTKFLCFMKQHPDVTALNEYSAAKCLDELRSRLPGYLELSFPTISAYGANAAMMHYEATEEDNAPLQPEGFLLVDSGGQYMTGTTDVTRTIALGPLTMEMIRHYTAVLRGHLDLAMATYLEGCTGRNLDILARQPMWEMGIDYKCGTGHGIGFVLNVHEGPQAIRWRYDKTREEAVLREGMLVTDEPGIYLAGEYGIRIENVLLCRNKEKTADGQFMDFEVLTLVPYDLDALDSSALTEREKEYLNCYHRRVYDEVSPYLEEGEREWLRHAARPL